MKKKSKKNTGSTIDLSERKNIKIIPMGKNDMLDSEIEFFKEQLNSRSKEAEDFHKYYIENQIKEAETISDEDLNNILKNIMKEHKILKSLIEEQEN